MRKKRKMVKRMTVIEVINGIEMKSERECNRQVDVQVTLDSCNINSQAKHYTEST